MRNQKNSLTALTMTGMFAAIIYIGIWILRFPIPAIVGRPFIHFGNTLTVVAILFLGSRNGIIAGLIGLGGFDILNGYAATSWLTMIQVIILGLVVDGLFRLAKYHDTKKNITIIAVVAGITKLITSYLASIVEALMVGTSFKVAIISSFFSQTATVINSISTAIMVPIIYFFVRKIYHSIKR
ncbi:ECF transporter S component [Lactobacillus sp. ESL0684]|uniref:ECF transporter S component n=1 Tax=unclassified Lactobacillus TaxID=2620435 RepID=UPI0023F74FA8|nr:MULTISPECIES: ECF transporter S component [unclassified Lactobacillus]WEV41146.1 ECF transporter S component [Lactobacillus sp. ESL0681]WEV44029.1 ECF transporter S component [Lactobacillus sp. ESL0684]